MYIYISNIGIHIYICIHTYPTLINNSICFFFSWGVSSGIFSLSQDLGVSQPPSDLQATAKLKDFGCFFASLCQAPSVPLKKTWWRRVSHIYIYCIHIHICWLYSFDICIVHIQIYCSDIYIYSLCIM